MGYLRKHNVFASILTVFIISILLLSGPARAIDVSLTTQDIDISIDSIKTFDVTIQVNEGEFLPLLYTNLTFNDGGNELTCKILDDNSVEGCSFLTVESREISNLGGGYGYGYGYGYNPGFGYGYNSFGYGYGYGYGIRGVLGAGSGTIKYTLTVTTSELPGSFTDREIDVEAEVVGGSEDNKLSFKGSSSFDVSASPVETAVDITKQHNITYNDITLEIPADILPAGTTKVTIEQVAPTADPSTATLKILGKTYEFDVDSSTKTFSGAIEITLSYTDEELNLVGITDETKISPAFYNIATGDWETLTVLLRDTTNNKITFETTHFTQFTLLADISTPPTPPSTPLVGSGPDRRAISSEEVEEEPEGEITPVVLPPTPPEEETPEEEAPEASTEALEEEASQGFLAITGAAIGNFFSDRNPISIGTIIVVIVGAFVMGVYVVNPRRRRKLVVKTKRFFRR